MKHQRAIGVVALASFLIGSWLVSALHGPLAHIAHECGAASCHDLATAKSEQVASHAHRCSHGHFHKHDPVHKHDSVQKHDWPADSRDDHSHEHGDCPVCQQLTMPVITAAYVQLPALVDVLVESVQDRPFEVPRGLIGLSLSRGPPTC